MKITNTQSNVELGGIADDATGFSIQDSGKAFQILSSGIYSNKIAAVVRELSCNAHDAHVVVGKKEIPFEVHVPTYEELWFSVKDEGPGLNKEDVIQLYSRYFKSTKTESNELIGAFGLGSKSPFAYTTAFMITSVYEGMKYTFNAFMADGGLPKIAMISEIKTAEDNGIEVKVPVKREDIQLFQIEMLRYLRHFPAQPIVTNDDSWKWPNKPPMFEGNGWSYYPLGNYHSDVSSYALQGYVPYDFNASPLPESINYDAKNMIDRLHMKIEFNIGELEIAASREAISYNPQTVANMNKKLVKTYNEMQVAVKTKLESFQGTDWIKSIAQQKFKRDNQNLFYVFNVNIKHDFTLSFLKFPKTEVFDNSTSPPKNHKGYSLQTTKQINFPINEKTLFFVQDVRVPRTWVREYVAKLPDSTSNNNRPVWVINPNGEDIEKILAEIGNPDFRLTSSVPKPASAIREHKPAKASEHKYFGIGELSGGSRAIEKGETIFAVEKRYDIIIHNYKKKLNLHSIISNAQALGFLKDHEDIKEVFIMTKGERKKLNTRIKVIDFFDFIIEKFNSWVAEHQDEIVMHKTAKQTASLPYDIRKLLRNTKEHTDYQKIKGTSLYELAEEFEKHDDVTLNEHITSLAYYLELDIKADSEITGTDRLMVAKDKILKEYPLLAITLSHSDSDFHLSSMLEYVVVMNKLKKYKKSFKLAS